MPFICWAILSKAASTLLVIDVLLSELCGALSCERRRKGKREDIACAHRESWTISSSGESEALREVDLLRQLESQLPADGLRTTDLVGDESAALAVRDVALRRSSSTSFLMRSSSISTCALAFRSSLTILLASSNRAVDRFSSSAWRVAWAWVSSS